MARMIAFLVPVGVAHALNRMAAEAHAVHGIDAGLVAAHALQCGLSALHRAGLSVPAQSGEFDRLRLQILKDGGSKGALPLRQARVS